MMGFVKDKNKSIFGSIFGTNQFSERNNKSIFGAVSGQFLEYNAEKTEFLYKIIDFICRITFFRPQFVLDTSTSPKSKRTGCTTAPDYRQPR